MPSESASCGRHFPAADYDLSATLDSGQAFRWNRLADGRWEGIVQDHCLRLRQTDTGIEALASGVVGDWGWLEQYLQTSVPLESILQTFPKEDPALLEAVAACRGLRLLRQDPWECLASFILSSTKQICQIRQCVELLTRRLGARLSHLDPSQSAFAFPSVQAVAESGEEILRACKMGFRARYLLGSARMIHEGQVDLAAVAIMPLHEARDELCRLPGVGRKIADCVLLFAYGFPTAFPVDVWVERVLRESYFGGRGVPRDRMIRFIEEHFGPNAGYAQQYLFHYRRTIGKTQTPARGRTPRPSA